MALTIKDNYVKEALNRLPSQDRYPIKSKLLALSAESYQKLDDLFYAISQDLYITTAKGYFLDRIGNDFKVYREGRTDDDYRDEIYAQIEINTSGGEPDAIINAVKRITEAERVVYMEAGIAHFLLNIIGGNYVSSLIRLIQSIKPLGVSFSVSESEDEDYMRVSEAEYSIDNLGIDSGGFANPQPGILLVGDESGVYNLQVCSSSSDNYGMALSEVILNDVFLEVNDGYLLSVGDESGEYYLELSLTDDERPRYSDEYGGKLTEAII